jgi:predicted nucleic acid-binding protein
MNLIVDASIAVKWFLDEEGCEDARSLLDTGSLFAPDLILLETYNAVWKRWRRGEARASQLGDLVRLLTQGLEKLIPSGDLAIHAAALSRELRHPVYDCVYLALAARERAPLVSADQRLVKIARRAKIEARSL